MSPQTLPMPNPAVPRRPLLSFKLLSFDIYGTLIDWETSIITALGPLLLHLPSSSPLRHDRQALAGKFNDHEYFLQKSQPSLRYDLLLAQCYQRLASDLKIAPYLSLDAEATAFGNSVGSWTAFPDTVSACQRLAKFYKLVPLSNVDRISFEKTLAGPLNGIPFWRYYLAEDIGSYKPDLNNFHYLIEHVREESEGEVGKEQILHTAQSLMHDHVPAKEMGMSSVWIARKGAGMGGDGEELHEKGKVGYGWRFGSLGEMADAVEAEAEARAGGK